MNYYLQAFKQYADFKGRATRSEYWMFILFNFIAGLILVFLFPLFVIYYFAVLVPTLAVLVRRLHDTGRSGWWALISLIPFGGIVLIVFLCGDSQVETNQWGPNPKLAPAPAPAPAPVAEPVATPVAEATEEPKAEE